VLWAARRLAQRHEANRTLIVLSDGFPAGDGEELVGLWKHLKQAVLQVERAGIQCIGFGIKSESVGYFYDNSVVFNSLKDLVAGAYKQVSQLLRGARQSGR